MDGDGSCATAVVPAVTPSTVYTALRICREVIERSDWLRRRTSASPFVCVEQARAYPGYHLQRSSEARSTWLNK